MRLDIVPFDPKTASEAEWRRYHAYRRRRHLERDPEDPVVDDRTEQTLLKRGSAQSEERLFAALDPNDPETQIGGLYFEVFREGSPSYEANKHLVWIGLGVLKPHRRQGVGTALLEIAAQLAREHGKSVLQSYVEEEDGKAFMKAANVEVAQQRRENRLRLDKVDWGMVKRWAEEGPVRSPETSLVWSTNDVDDAIVEEYCKVFTETFNLQPFGDLDMNDFTFTPETFRQEVRKFTDAGGTWLSACTREPSGDISGLTEMGYLPTEATILRQFLTGVRDRYQGRGLGKWLKAAMLLRARKEFSKAKVVVTGNASSNEAMLSINERLGFRTHKEPVMAQMRLDALEKYLAK